MESRARVNALVQLFDRSRLLKSFVAVQNGSDYVETGLTIPLSSYSDWLPWISGSHWLSPSVELLIVANSFLLIFVMLISFNLTWQDLKWLQVHVSKAWWAWSQEDDLRTQLLLTKVFRVKQCCICKHFVGFVTDMEEYFYACCCMNVDLNINMHASKMQLTHSSCLFIIIGVNLFYKYWK